VALINTEFLSQSTNIGQIKLLPVENLNQKKLIYFSVNQFEKRLNNQFRIAQTTAAATAKIIAYSRSGTRRPIDAPQSEQNFG
jgi:hypothetical protein